MQRSGGTGHIGEEWESTQSTRAPSATRSPRRGSTALYREQGARSSRYALRRVDAPEDAADVVAETFLVAWRRFGEVPVDDGARLWLYATARQVIANQRRGDAAAHAPRRRAARRSCAEQLPRGAARPSRPRCCGRWRELRRRGPRAADAGRVGGAGAERGGAGARDLGGGRAHAACTGRGGGCERDLLRERRGEELGEDRDGGGAMSTRDRPRAAGRRRPGRPRRGWAGSSWARRRRRWPGDPRRAWPAPTPGAGDETLRVADAGLLPRPPPSPPQPRPRRGRRGARRHRRRRGPRSSRGGASEVAVAAPTAPSSSASPNRRRCCCSKARAGGSRTSTRNGARRHRGLDGIRHRQADPLRIDPDTRRRRSGPRETGMFAGRGATTPGRTPSGAGQPREAAGMARAASTRTGGNWSSCRCSTRPPPSPPAPKCSQPGRPGNREMIATWTEGGVVLELQAAVRIWQGWKNGSVG